jgi:hypothetical protein
MQLRVVHERQSTRREEVVRKPVPGTKGRQRCGTMTIPAMRNPLLRDVSDDYACAARFKARAAYMIGLPPVTAIVAPET